MSLEFVSGVADGCSKALSENERFLLEKSFLGGWFLCKKKFDDLFLEEVVDPLLDFGCQAIGMSKSLVFQSGPLQFSVIRLGARYSRPNSIAHVGAVRHASLRKLKKEKSRSGTSEVICYPFRTKISELKTFLYPEWSYTPSNLSYDSYVERLCFDRPESEVTLELRELRKNLSDSAHRIPNNLTVFRCLNELRANGETAFCEKLWIEDYMAHLEATSGGRIN